MTLEERIDALEQIGPIRALRHRYPRASDAEDAEGFRAAFIDGPAGIDHGLRIGRHPDADAPTAALSRIANSHAWTLRSLTEPPAEGHRVEEGDGAPWLCG